MSPDPAAVYYRMSTDKQEDSIDRQKSQVIPYAEQHGYAIVREYVDEGISGSEIAKRKEFQRLLRDAQAGHFKAILCDDQDRFGRFDSLEFGEIASPLRRKGVWLDTVAQGKVDWESFGGRMTGLFKQEGKHQEQEDIARRVLTGLLRKAKRGDYLGGPVPYAYQLVDDPTGGKKLVPHPYRADVVRLMFRLCDEGHSLGAIAAELYARGVATPTGKPRWSRSAILNQLTQRKYIGDGRWGVQRAGKRCRLTGGDVRPTPRGEGRGLNPEEDWVIVPDHHEPIITRDQFERVRARLKGNRGRTTPHVGGGEFLLTKLLVCDHCGAFLLGHTQRGRRLYVCGGYHAYGKDYCRRNQVHEAPLVDFLIRRLQKAFLDPANLAKLREEVSAIEQAQRSEDNLTGLQRRLDGLDKKVREGTSRLLSIPPDLIDDAAQQVRQWKREREAVQAELNRAANDSPLASLEAKVAAAESVLWKLREALQADDYPLLRQLLREMVARIELRWTHGKAANGQNASRLEGGVVWLRTQAGGVDMLSSAPERTGRRAASCGNGTAPPG